MRSQRMVFELIPSVKRTFSIHAKEEKRNDYAHTSKELQIVER